MPLCSVDPCDRNASYHCPGCNCYFCPEHSEPGPDGYGRFCEVCSNRLDTLDKGNPPKAPVKSHKQAITEIKDFISKQGGKPYVLHQVGKVYGSAGIPDMCAFVPVNGNMRFMWIEVKVGDDTLSLEQKGFIEYATMADIPYVVGDVNDVEQTLREIRRAE